MFDADNRLEKVMQGPNVLGEYTYDASGQRMSKTVDNLTTKYYYDDINLLYTRENDAVSETVLRKRSGGIIKSLRGDSEYPYHMDIRGSITNILDGNDTVVKSYNYDAYGNTTASSPAFKSNFAYTGAVNDEETGLYYLSARYYDTETSRFISEDPARDGDSWYSYCAGDPVNCADLTGLAAGDLYTSASSAVNNLAYNFYRESLYIRREYSSVIYTKRANGRTYYCYTNYVAGSWHSCQPKDGHSKVPSTGTIYGYVHTHPNSNNFSDADKTFVNSTKRPLYLISPNKSIQVCENTARGASTATIYTSVNMKDPSASRKKELVKLYQGSWEHHIRSTCGFNCSNRKWPAF